MIEDGLGAEDIHKVYTFFDRLSKIPPRQPSNISLSFTSAPALAIADGSVSNGGVGDLSVDISWYPTELENGTCVVKMFDDLTEDISYYALSLKVGFTDYSCTHHLFYRISDLDAMNREIDVPMEHINFEHLSSTKKTRYEIALTATDKRNDLSPSFSKYYFVDNLPLGVKSYQLRSQQNDLQDKAVIKPYYDIYNGTGTAYVHKVTGNVDGVYHYQVRLYDKNGNISPWFYIPDKVKLDPLKPPEPPKPYVKSTEINSIEFAWNYVKTADKYEIDPLYSSAANWIITSNTKLITGLNENTSYSVRIRATNRAGSSSWVTISGRTKARPILTYTQTSLRSRTWRTSYYILKQNGRVVRPASEYRYEMDNEEVIHGEWIELRNKIQNGIAVKKGTRWEITNPYTF
ncbi:fibronectin type III domain-containing protein [Priestia megaterium]